MHVGTTTSKAIHGLRTQLRASGSNPVSRAWHNRHVITFALANAWRPRAVLTAAAAYDDAVRSRELLFLPTSRTDEVSDAFRHTYAAALLTSRLHTERGMSVERAGTFMRRLGEAHEADSQLRGVARRNTSAMDLHNNDLGISLVSPKGVAATYDQRIADAALSAIGEGKAQVLDDQLHPPRASTRAELDAALRTPPSLSAARSPRSSPARLPG